MLLGTIVHHTNQYTSYFGLDVDNVTYDFKGFDTSSCLYGKLSSSSYDAINIMAGSLNDEDCLWERRFDVGIAKTTEQIGYTRVNNKLVKYNVNHNFFGMLGALIRYCKSMCKSENAVGYTGLSSASGEFVPEDITTYNIPAVLIDATGSRTRSNIGTVTLKLGEITGMHIKSPYYDIDIEDHPELELEIFDKIKNTQGKGFTMSEGYLGFEPCLFEVQESSALDAEMYGSLDEVIANHPNKNYLWLRDKKYAIVTDETLDEVVNIFRSVPSDDFIFFDTETTGLNINFKSRIGQADQCVGLILSYKDGESYFFPMQMRHIKNLCNGDHFYFMEHYMRDILENKQLVAHNMSFDWKVAYIYDINANIVHDTMAMLELTLAQERLNFPTALKEASRLLLGRDSLELGDLVIAGSWGENDVRFWDLPAELVRLYACADTDNTRGIFQYVMQNDLLHKYNAERVYNIEVTFSLAVGYQEFYGHKIDTDNLESLHDEINKEQKYYMDKMVEEVGYEFNPNSPKQLLQIMYTELGIPEQISYKTGRPTTDKETLKALASISDLDGNPTYPFVVNLQKYREAEGVRKIVDKFPETATDDGYIFSAVQQYGTRTGRVSIKKPNYQSYNDPVKKNIVPRPGYYMTDTDYSSIEYRVLGNMAGNKMIMEGFVDPDFDYHAYQASRIYNVPYASVTSKLRKAAKGINFGLPYGMGDESLGTRVFGERCPENTAKAAALRAKYFEGQEDIKDFFEVARSQGVEKGYTETFFGRRRYYHRNQYSVNKIRKQAGNAVIQGSAADIYKLAVGRVFLRICKEGWLGKVLLTGFIHDEVLCEVHNSIDPMKWLKALREEFEVKIEGWCPLYMGFGFGMSWYEAKKTEIPIQLQWEFVDKYGETGYPDWDGDGRKFCDKVVEHLREFSIRHVKNGLTSPDAQGKEVNVAINKAMYEVLAEDKSCYDSILESYKGVVNLSSDDRVKVVSELNADYISDILYSDEGNILFEMPSSEGMTTQSAIDLFCQVHSIDRSTINVLDISEVSAKPEETKVVDTNKVLEESIKSNGELSDDDKQAIMDARVESFGLYLDTDASMIILKMLPAQYMNFIKQHSNNNQKGYRIRFKDSDNNMFYDTQCYIASEEVSILQEMYIGYFKAIRQH